MVGEQIFGKRVWMARYNVSLDILSLTESPALLRQKKHEKSQVAPCCCGWSCWISSRSTVPSFFWCPVDSLIRPALKLFKNLETSGNKLQLFPILQRISHSPKDIQKKKTPKVASYILIHMAELADIYLCFPTWTSEWFWAYKKASSPEKKHDVIYILIHTN